MESNPLEMNLEQEKQMLISGIFTLTRILSARLNKSLRRAAKIAQYRESSFWLCHKHFSSIRNLKKKKGHWTWVRAYWSGGWNPLRELTSLLPQPSPCASPEFCTGKTCLDSILLASSIFSQETPKSVITKPEGGCPKYHIKKRVLLCVAL